MANWDILKSAIAGIIKTNGNQEITGQLLQNVLNDIVSSVGENASFAGIATPTTNPGAPDGPILYFATQAGTYSNFNGIELLKGESAILKWDNGTWAKNTFKPMIDFDSVLDANGKSLTEFESGIIYDVSALNGGVTFESLSALLSSSNLSTLIPTSVRHGGMSIRFIQGSVPNADNKYVQYRLMSDEFSTDVTQWQGIDEEPTEGSNNLAKSGSVFELQKEIIGTEDKVINVSSFPVHDAALTPTWNYIPGFNHIVIPVKAGQNYLLENNNVYQASLAFFKTYSTPIQGQAPDYSDGTTKFDMQNGNVLKVQIPSDCHYLYMTANAGGYNRLVNTTLLGTTGEIDQKYYDIVGKETIIDLSQYFERNGVLAYGSWGAINNDWTHKVIPVVPGEKYKLVANNTLGTYALFKTYSAPVAGQAPDYCQGTSATNIKANTEVIVTIPSDANYLYITYKVEGNIRIDSVSNIIIGKLQVVQAEVESKVSGKLQALQSEVNTKVSETKFDEQINVTEENNLRQMSNVVAGYGLSNFTEKAIPIKVPVDKDGLYKYNAWPFITTYRDRLVCLYARTKAHEYSEKRDIYMQYSFDGIVWSSETKVISNVNALGAITAIGNDSNGNIIAWLRNGGIGAINELYRSTDGYIFEKISTLSSPAEFNIEGLTSIINVPTVGLMSFFCTYYLQNQQPSRWGIATSNDDGLTWTLQLKWQEIDAFKCPMETNGVYLGDGKILAMARRDIPGTPYTLHHIQSSDYGQTWTLADSNVDDILSSTPSLLYDSTTQKVTVFYVKRVNYNNILKVREADLSAVWDKPTNWPDSRDINTMQTYDGGQVNAEEFNGKKFAAVYAGSKTEDGIYITMVQ